MCLCLEAARVTLLLDAKDVSSLVSCFWPNRLCSTPLFIIRYPAESTYWCLETASISKHDENFGILSLVVSELKFSDFMCTKVGDQEI